MALTVEHVKQFKCGKCGHSIDGSSAKPLTTMKCPECDAGVDVPAKFDNFVLIKRLGRGAKGTVYRAKDALLDRDVAIKVLKSDGKENAVIAEKTINEARNLAALNHPNIVQIFHLGNYENQPYIVMELLDGGSAKKHTKAFNKLDEAAGLDLAIGIAEGLGGANEAGLLHRDVKPSNILYDANKRAKLIDFGLAQKEDDQLVGGIGSPYYIAPEVARNKPYDFRADMYSLGVSVYHVLAGKPPFKGDDIKQIVKARFEGEPPVLSDVRSDLQVQTVATVRRMMSVDPDERYPTYEALLKDLAIARKTLNAPTPPPMTNEERAAAELAAAHYETQSDVEQSIGSYSITAAPTDVDESNDNNKRPIMVAAAVAAILLLATAIAVPFLRDNPTPDEPDPPPITKVTPPPKPIVPKVVDPTPPDPIPVTPDPPKPPKPVVPVKPDPPDPTPPDPPKPPPKPKPIAPVVIRTIAGTRAGKVELDFVDEPGLSLQIKANASRDTGGSLLPIAAFDNNPQTVWSAGIASKKDGQWIEADLGETARLHDITLAPVLADAKAEHDILISDKPIGKNIASARVVHTIKGTASDSINRPFPPNISARFVQIRTRHSSSWVAWRDINIGTLRATKSSMATDTKSNTWWSGRGVGSWFRFDLEQPAEIDRVGISFGFEERTYKFDVHTSPENTDWSLAGQFENDGKTTGYQIFKLKKPVKAQHIKLTLAESDSRYFHIRDTYVAGPASEKPPKLTTGADKPTKTKNNATIDLRKGLTLNWSFDEVADHVTDVKDSSGRGLNGKADGNVGSFPTRTEGVHGHAVIFDGNDDRVRVDNRKDLLYIHRKNHAFTAWIKPDTLPSGRGSTAYAAIVCASRHNKRPNFGIYLRADSTIALRYPTDEGNDGFVELKTSMTIDLNQWHFIAGDVDYKTRTMRVFINGELAGERTIAADVKPGDKFVTWHVGCNHWNGNNKHQFTGAIDDARIYSRSLAQNEVLALTQLRAKPTSGPIPMADLQSMVIRLRGDNDRRRAKNNFIALQPVHAKTTHSSVLIARDDASIIVPTKPKSRDVYTLRFQTSLNKITALRFEALPDAALPDEGPGWGSSGAFYLSDIDVAVTPLDGSAPAQRVTFSKATDDTELRAFKPIGAIDYKPATRWGINKRPGIKRTATFIPSKPIAFTSGAVLTLDIRNQINIGCFRLLATSSNNQELLKTPRVFTGSAAINFGKEKISRRGVVWEPATEYVPGLYGHVGGNLIEPFDKKNPLISSFIENPTAIRFDVPNGKYELKLYFAEYQHLEKGKRQFHIEIEGNKSELIDIFDQGSPRTKALIHSPKIEVRDGNLMIVFHPVRNKKPPIISAITVKRTGPLKK